MAAVGAIAWLSNQSQTSGTDPRRVISIFDAFLNNLPLTLPVLSVLLSVMVNVRELLRPYGWERLPLTISLGLVSFSIWYVVTAQSNVDQFIRVGPEKLLDKAYAPILLIIAFTWSGFCAIARLLSDGVPDDQRGFRWHAAQNVLLLISVIGLSTPFFLFEAKEDVEKRIGVSLDSRSFTVSIPYRDSSLQLHLGRGAILECFVLRDVRARTASDAIKLALGEFGKEAQSKQRFRKDDQQVEVVEGLIVVELNARASR